MAMLGVQLIVLPGRWHSLEGSSDGVGNVEDMAGDEEVEVDGGVVKDDVATSL